MAKQTVARKPQKRGKKKGVRTVSSGIAHIKASFNNTIISITDAVGNLVSWASAGKVGFSGSKKSAAFAATVAAQDAAKIAMSVAGMKEVEVNFNGPGSGRESAVRGLQAAGLTISLLRDRTPVPHNGCRPRKRRRA